MEISTGGEATVNVEELIGRVVTHLGFMPEVDADRIAATRAAVEANPSQFLLMVEDAEDVRNQGISPYGDQVDADDLLTDD